MKLALILWAAFFTAITVSLLGCVGTQPPPVTQSGTKATTQPAKTVTLDLGNRVTMKLVLIPAGTFLMGNPEEREDRRDYDRPQREVTISSTFYMGVYEVTQGQWKAVMGTGLGEERDKSNKSWLLYGEGRDYPMYYVSWEAAAEFCRMLSAKTGKTVRLPTEAEWEFACRAGSGTRFCFGDDYKGLAEFGWYSDNGGGSAHPVGQKKPNAWGLHDMHGNVWEWCSDWYSDSYANLPHNDPAGPSTGRFRVLRGGSWHYVDQACRSCVRMNQIPQYRGDVDSGPFGFRIVVSCPLAN